MSILRASITTKYTFYSASLFLLRSAKGEGHKGSEGIRGKREFSEFKECSEVRDKCW